MTATPISSTAFNTLESDIGNEITNSLDRLGRSAMQAALPMGNNKITGTADPTVSTDAATKNYVDTTTAAFFSTGDVKLTFKIVPDSGWLLFDDGTFGSASSGSSNSNSANNQALFTLFFNAPFTDGNLPILTSGGGATTRAAQVSAAAAWASNCRMTLPRTLGRALALAGTGSGLTIRIVGSFFGTETTGLVPLNIPSITSTGTNNITVNSADFFLKNGGAAQALGGGGVGFGWTNSPVLGGTQSTGNNNITVGWANASPTAINIMQPTSFLNGMVKQ